MIHDKVKNKINFSKIGATRHSGFIEDYMQNMFKKRIDSDFAKENIFKEAENAFLYQEDDRTPVGYWRGEFWGKLAISACRVCRYSGNDDLKAFLQKTAHTVLSYANEEGYINSYAHSDRVVPVSPEEAIREVGWPCDWNWNIWCRKYTLWGLVECADLTGDQSILNGAHKLATQLIHQLKRMQLRLSETGTRNFCGLPSGSILKPMLILYRMTEDKELLDFCIDAAEDWDREDGKCPNLIRNGIANTPVHIWYPHSERWAKAYEMMSCLDGLLELYRITGTKKYFIAVSNIFQQLKTHEGNVMSSVGFNDIFAHAAKYQNALTEPCDVIHWMRLGSELYALTGDIQYMNAVEAAFYNAYIAGVSDDGTWGARVVRSSGIHYPAEAQCTFLYSQCCVNNMPRGYINVTQTSVMTAEDALYINQYCPFVSETDLSGHAVTVTVSDGYIDRGKVSISVSTEVPITVMLRIPDFAGEGATVSGAETVTPNSYCRLALSAGETTIYVDFDFSAQVHDFPYAMPDLPEDDFRIARWITENSWKTETGEVHYISPDNMMKERCSYITYGPLLLAQSKKTGASKEEMFAFDSICGQSYRADAEAIHVTDPTVMAAYKVTLTNDRGDCFTRTMCAYGTAADTTHDAEEQFFNIYL